MTTASRAGPAWVTGIPGVPGAVLMPDAGAGLRERKKVATRHALGVAAMRLAMARGLENVLVEDIAEAAGVSARTFNNYFASKYEAICALGFDRAMRIGAALRERPEGEPLWDAIVAAVMSEYGSADRALDEDWMAGLRLVTSTPVLRGEYLKVQAMMQFSLGEAIALRAGFEPGRAGGSGPSGSGVSPGRAVAPRASSSSSMFPRILAASVTAAVQAAMERWMHADPPTALAPVIRRSLEQLADGMREVLPPRRAPDAAARR
ncbi:MAG: TetR family transcriptional regulator [Streptosporangiaceae bacterium]